LPVADHHAGTGTGPYRTNLRGGGSPNPQALVNALAICGRDMGVQGEVKTRVLSCDARLP